MLRRLRALEADRLDDLGGWLAARPELAAQGHQVRLLMTHHAYDQLKRTCWEAAEGVMVYYVGQMHVYGPVGRRRYFGPAALLRVLACFRRARCF